MAPTIEQTTLQDGLFFLTLSLMALGLGPLLHAAMQARPRLRRLRRGVDGFVLVSLVGLLGLHVLPELFLHAGWWMFAALGAGALIPSLLERGQHGDHGHHAPTQSVALWLGLLGVILHTTIDGAALAREVAGSDQLAMALAVLMHRLPVSLAIWWLVQPRHGARAALGMLGLMGLGTVAGFGLGHTMTEHLSTGGTALFQAFVAGSLLHVLFHDEHPDEAAASAKTPETTASPRLRGPLLETIGGALGVLVVLGVPLLTRLHDLLHPHDTAADARGHAHGHAAHGHGHAHGHPELITDAYLERLLDLSLDVAPALVLGFALAGVVGIFLPSASARWLRGGSSLGQAARGVLFGLPLPICSCGVVPLYRGLITRGVPASAAMAFLVATPELGLDALLISLPLLGGKLTLARLISAFLVALAVGWGLGRLVPTSASDEAHDHEGADDRSTGERVRAAARLGFVEVAGDTAAWIVVGLLIAAAISPGAMTSWLTGWPPGADVLLFALAGLPLYVCASGATPLAAAFILAGASPGAALAFLIAGPASNATTVGVLAQSHGRRVALLFAALVVGLSVALGLLTNLAIGTSAPLITNNAHAHTAHGPLAWASLAIVGVSFLGVIARQGPRAFLRSVLRTPSLPGVTPAPDTSGCADGCCGCDEEDATQGALTPVEAAPSSCCGSTRCGEERDAQAPEAPQHAAPDTDDSARGCCDGGSCDSAPKLLPIEPPARAPSCGASCGCH